jgi:RNA polymerase sigma-70 factor, ECF subfamily
MVLAAISMGIPLDAEPSFTRQLSQEIDAAYEAYAAQLPYSEIRLYRTLRAQSRNVVWSRLGAPDAPLEHDIATRAIQALKEFRGESRVSTWFYALAQHEANRALRKLIQKRELEVPIEIDEDDGEPKIALPASPANSDAPIQLAELIRDLPAEQAEVIQMDREGYSLEEIAERTGNPLGTVRSRYRPKFKVKKKGIKK